MFVRHHDRTRTISYITKNGIVRSKSWTRQIFSDAWESTNWEDLGNPLHTVVAETKLTEKFIEDEKGKDLLLPRMLVKKPLGPGYAFLTLHGQGTKPRKDEFRERVGTIIERTLGRRSQDGNIHGQKR